MQILVGYDGSNSSKAAVGLAVKHAKAFSGTVHLAASLIKGTENELEEIANAENELEEVKKTFDAEGVACETHLLIRGMTPGEDLVEFAREKGIEEIIMGVKRRSKVGKMVFGSTAQFVILNADCPVVTIK
ncbi:MAG: universal stress protein [Desulfobacteraceae bacterium]|nr:universal stress protein [Desulfobacteraceae bacterium]